VGNLSEGGGSKLLLNVDIQTQALYSKGVLLWHDESVRTAV